MKQSKRPDPETGLGKEYFPIRVLCERTGVGSSTLRAWERRYGLINPQRTPKGHRLYTADDVRLVEYVLTLLREGHSLAAIASHQAGSVSVMRHTSDSVSLVT